MPTTPTIRTPSRHEAILGDLKDKILGGDWPPGHKLPFETDLAHSFDVSRMTMNKVLTQLSREGFLVRRRRLGTFVASPQGQSAMMEITDIPSEVTALGIPHRWEMTRRIVRDLTPRELSQVRPGRGGTARVLEIDGIHHAGDTPFCREWRLIHLAAAPAAGTEDFAVSVPGNWLLQQIPWSAAEHRIRAVNADDETAALLDLDPGAACLEVVRRTEIDGCWVTLVHQTYPGMRHQLTAQFEPRREGG